MLKPDAVMRGLMGEIIERFEIRGFKLVALKFMQADKELLQTHYSDLSKKAFFPELIRYMGSGPVVPMVFEGLNAVKQGRTMLGATNPKDSAPGTIRGDLCIDVGRNIIHGSDSVESANKEIALWFKPQELSQWRTCQVEWVYEEEELDQTKATAMPPSKSVRQLLCALLMFLLPLHIFPYLALDSILIILFSCSFWTNLSIGKMMMLYKLVIPLNTEKLDKTVAISLLIPGLVGLCVCITC